MKIRSTPQVVMNLLALIILGLVAVLLIFNAVPPGNRELMSAIVGGVIGVLVGAGNASMFAHEPSAPVAPSTAAVPAQPE